MVTRRQRPVGYLYCVLMHRGNNFKNRGDIEIKQPVSKLCSIDGLVAMEGRTTIVEDICPKLAGTL